MERLVQICSSFISSCFLIQYIFLQFLSYLSNLKLMQSIFHPKLNFRCVEKIFVINDRDYYLLLFLFPKFLTIWFNFNIRLLACLLLRGKENLRKESTRDCQENSIGNGRKALFLDHLLLWRNYKKKKQLKKPRNLLQYRNKLVHLFFISVKWMYPSFFFFLFYLKSSSGKTYTAEVFKSRYSHQSSFSMISWY